MLLSTATSHLHEREIHYNDFAADNDHTNTDHHSTKRLIDCDCDEHSTAIGDESQHRLAVFGCTYCDVDSLHDIHPNPSKTKSLESVNAIDFLRRYDIGQRDSIYDDTHHLYESTDGLASTSIRHVHGNVLHHGRLTKLDYHDSAAGEKSCLNRATMDPT